MPTHGDKNELMDSSLTKYSQIKWEFKISASFIITSPTQFVRIHE